jgi:rhodanese-related sulfurtransferase/tetratricopeptide (TPR) repeat protein
MIAVAVLFFVATRLLAPARESAQPATVDAKSGGAHARSIAVLPFINLSGDSAQAYFTDGITDDLITDLARLPGLLVIARNASFAYKGKQVRPQQIVAALQLKLPDTTGRRETSNPAAYDALLQGLERLRQGSEAETIAAIKAFERAVALDPDYARAHASLAAAHWQIVSSLWDAASGVGFQNANDSMRKHLALAMRVPTPQAHAVNAELASKEGRNSEALAEIDEALKLAPSDPDVRVTRARILNALGRGSDAEADVRRAIRLEPSFSPAYQSVLAVAQFSQQKYEEALATITEVVNRRSDVYDLATMIASLGQLGRTAGVREAIAKYNEINVAAGMDPLTVQEYNWWYHGDIFTYDDDYRDRLVQGLRKAGVPEGAGAELRLADYKRLISRREGEYTVRGVTEINLETTQAMLEAGAILVDVRPALDFERNGHIPGTVSLSLPVALSRDSLGKIVGPDDAVIFSCHGKYCPYSAYAGAKALLWGYKRVYRFAGGFPTWQAEGRPVAVGPSSQTADPEVASR